MTKKEQAQEAKLAKLRELLEEKEKQKAKLWERIKTGTLLSGEGTGLQDKLEAKQDQDEINLGEMATDFQAMQLTAGGRKIARCMHCTSPIPPGVQMPYDCRSCGQQITSLAGVSDETEMSGTAETEKTEANLEEDMSDIPQSLHDLEHDDSHFDEHFHRIMNSVDLERDPEFIEQRLTQVDRDRSSSRSSSPTRRLR